MKDLNKKWLINAGTIIYLIGLLLAIICLFMMFSDVVLFYKDEDWLIPAGVSYISGNLINFALYVVFRSKNAQKLKEIEDEYASQVEDGMPSINWLTWDPFLIKGFKMRYIKNAKAGVNGDSNDDNAIEQESTSSFRVFVWNAVILRPLYIMFLFSIPAHYKLKAIQKFESKNTQK